MEIINQLVTIYNTLDSDRALTDLEAKRYYSQMLAHGRLHLYTDRGYVIGLIESWRLDYEQLGRVICWHEFNALEEDVTVGPVAYISDIWVRPESRGTGKTKILIEMFKQANSDAEYYVSHRANHKVKYYRVYDKCTGYKHKLKET